MGEGVKTENIGYFIQLPLLLPVSNFVVIGVC